MIKLTTITFTCHMCKRSSLPIENMSELSAFSWLREEQGWSAEQVGADVLARCPHCTALIDEAQEEILAS